MSRLPAGKRLVIEHVSGHCFNFSGAPPTYFQIFSTVVPGAIVYLSINSDGIASQPMRLYADAGAVVSIFVPIAQGGSGDCDYSVTGYYVNLP